ncbi:MAG: hypothetical protein ACP5HU_03605 [Phycisphaerae bacterium]
MSRQQKIIMLTVGVYVAGFVVYLMVNSLWLAPARAISRSIGDKRRDLTGQESLIRSEPRLRRELAEFAARTLGYDETVVRERVRERLMELLRRSGLGSAGLSLDLFDGLRRKAYREVGATVRTTGSLRQVVSFLLMLRSEPVLHRLENLSITPARGGGGVDLQFRYVTVVPVVEGKRSPTTLPVDSPVPQPPAEQRELFDAIVMRDLFRPYIKRPQPPVVAHNPQPQPQPQPEPPLPQPQPPSPPPEDSFRVVGLPTMGGEVQVHLHDPGSGQVLSCEIGDEVGDASIVGVDYRRMRWGEEYSTSRLVLFEEGTYWGVELGDTIGQKRPLKETDLPLELRADPTSAPADSAGDEHSRG